MVLGSHANTRAMYSTPPWPTLAASMAAYRRRSFSDNHPKKRCIFSSISAEYTSMLDSVSQNLCCRKDTTAQACREVILDHILNVMSHIFSQNNKFGFILIFTPFHRIQFSDQQLGNMMFLIGLIHHFCIIDLFPHWWIKNLFFDCGMNF